MGCGLCGKAMGECDCRTRPKHDTNPINCVKCGEFLAWFTWLHDWGTGRWRQVIDVPAYYSRAPGDELRYYVSEGNKKQLSKGLRTVRSKPGRRLHEWVEHGVTKFDDTDIPRAIHPARDFPLTIVCMHCGRECRWNKPVANA